jgi:hypothetical protein
MELMSDSNVPKIIWCYWNNNNIPKFIKFCLSTWEKNLPDYKINLIIGDDIYNYLDYDNNMIIKIKKFMCRKHIALHTDFYRIALLYKYGGFWIDITTIININNLDFVHNAFINDPSLDVFYSIKNINFNTDFYSWESFFIAAKPKTEFMLIFKNFFENIILFKTALKPLTQIECNTLHLCNSYHLVYVIHIQLAKTNDYFNKQCKKQTFDRDEIFLTDDNICLDIIERLYNHYVNNKIDNEIINKYKLFKIWHDPYKKFINKYNLQ